MAVEHRLDFGRIDVKAEPDNQFLRTTDDEEVTVFEAREVACIEPSLRVNGLGGLVGCAIVTFHNARAVNPQFTGFAVVDWLTIESDQFDLRPREYSPNGDVRPVRLHSGLRHGGSALRH